MQFADNLHFSLPRKDHSKHFFSKLYVVFASHNYNLELPNEIKHSYQIRLQSDFQNIIEITHFKKIDALIIDCDSLGKEALEFLKQRLYHQSLAEIPIIIITQNPQNNLEEFIINRIDDYYIGPLNSNLFILRFKNFITQHCLLTDNTTPEEDRVDLAFMAYYDKLTSLPNRRLFQERVESKIAPSNYPSSSFAIFFLDLDGFKLINDQNSHEAGDWLLNQVGLRLKNCVKKGDTVARLGGDEFAVLLDEIADRNILEKISHRILYRLSAPYLYNNSYLKINVSIGISIFPYDGRTYQDLINQADQAMYTAKKKGKGQFSFAS